MKVYTATGEMPDTKYPITVLHYVEGKGNVPFVTLNKEELEEYIRPLARMYQDTNYIIHEIELEIK